MKTLRLSLALIVASLAFSQLVRAEDAKPAADKPAKCCAKAAADGKTCTHDCCAEAAKDGKKCEKCGGKNAPAKDEHAM
ncbi:MAG: hypothetical protein WC205_12470 [Opitutaceae bacterium]|jgi:hypothetical protein